MQARPLTTQTLRRSLSKMRSSGSCGRDGWRIAEVKVLPAFFLDRLAVLLNTVGETGVWPQALASSVKEKVPSR